ncbi:MAG: HAMP domain-containing protein [Myxococcales bacterium]|nr:HAMP domain-containing protein [Myxococcales bacterium]
MEGRSGRILLAALFGLGLAFLAWVMGQRFLDPHIALENDRGRDLVGLLVVGAFVCGGAIAYTAAWIVAESLTSLTRTARAMRRDLGIRTHVQGSDEVGQLAGALDELAGWLAKEKSSLEEDRNRLVAILESMGEGVLVTDPLEEGGDVVLANAMLRDMLVLDRSILGKRPADILPELGAVFQRAEVDGGAATEIELTGIKPGRILVRARPIRGVQDDKLQGLVAVFTDVTELRRLEIVRRDFVANVSHELRTPIMAIGTSTETLLAGALADPEVAQEMVEIVDRHSNRLRQLVEDLLELSKIESRGFRLERADVEPRVVVEASLEAVAVASRQRGVRVEPLFGEGLGTVRTDRRALEQVLVNLVDNAIKYGGPKPVRVLVTRNAGQLDIEVRDQGPGIEPRHLPRLFERFYRVDAGRSRAVGGTGLGLSIVKHLAEAMGGTIEVKSKVGQGTSFFVRIPVEAPPDSAVMKV